MKIDSHKELEHFRKREIVAGNRRGHHQTAGQGPTPASAGHSRAVSRRISGGRLGCDIEQSFAPPRFVHAARRVGRQTFTVAGVSQGIQASTDPHREKEFSARGKTACLHTSERHNISPLIRADKGSRRICERLTAQLAAMRFCSSFSCKRQSQHTQKRGLQGKATFIE